MNEDVCVFQGFPRPLPLIPLLTFYFSIDSYFLLSTDFYFRLNEKILLIISLGGNSGYSRIERLSINIILTSKLLV